MEGNGKKCDFGQNCKKKDLNTLTNCSKLTINHLRYLSNQIKSNSKELEIPENYLILNRAGINVITSQHLNRHICEQHRDELGIYWTRKKRTCAHPLHGDSKAKPDRGINAVMSREIWLRLQLVAIGEAVCKICTDKHKKQHGIGMEIEDEIRDKIRLIIPSSIEKNDTETDMIEPASHTLDHLSIHISEDNSSVEEYAMETDEIAAETEPILIAPASQDTNSGLRTVQRAWHQKVILSNSKATNLVLFRTRLYETVH